MITWLTGLASACLRDSRGAKESQKIAVCSSSLPAPTAKSEYVEALLHLVTKSDELCHTFAGKLSACRPPIADRQTISKFPLLGGLIFGNLCLV